jgi:hypothetical protein
MNRSLLYASNRADYSFNKAGPIVIPRTVCVETAYDDHIY